jgi:MFS family permease
MDFYRQLLVKSGTCSPVTFALVYLISVVFTFQTLVTAYSSSTYMEQFLRPEWVSLLFSLAAGFAIIFSLTLPRLLRHIGNVPVILGLMVLITLCLVIIGLAPTPSITIVAFIAFMAMSPQVYLNIDIFLETLIGTEEGSTGSRRGLILTIMSAAAFLSPLAMGKIIGDSENLSAVYFVGAAVGLVCIAIIISRFRCFYDPVYKTIRVRDMLRDAARNVNVRTVMATQFLLQFFYTWAIIYISIILAAGLLAFVIFEYPIGLIADRKLGEQEMMAVGFVILAIACASLSFMATVGIIGWMIIMFISRIGASLVEVTTESYFFKQVDGEEPNLISLFRLMRPLGNLIGALVGSISLLFLPLNLIFVVLAFIMASGVFITTRLTDTR